MPEKTEPKTGESPPNTAETDSRAEITGNGGGSTRFRPGTSGNPRGRPKGSRNRSTIVAERLLDGDVEELVGRLVAEAREGKPWALRLVIDRIIPPRRRSVVELELPRMERAEDIAQGIAAVIDAAAAGEITLEQAREFCQLLEAQRRILETDELAVRIEALEELRKEREK